jgi:hypothetical protein
VATRIELWVFPSRTMESWLPISLEDGCVSAFVVVVVVVLSCVGRGFAVGSSPVYGDLPKVQKAGRKILQQGQILIGSRAAS